MNFKIWKKLHALNNRNSTISIVSQRQQSETLQAIVESIRATSFTFVTLIAVFAFSNLLVVIRSSIVIREKIFASLQAIGMSKWQLATFINIENSLMIVVSWLFGVILTIIICAYVGSSWKNTWFMYLPIWETAISLLVVVAAHIIVSIRPISKIFNGNIVETLHYDG